VPMLAVANLAAHAPRRLVRPYPQILHCPSSWHLALMPAATNPHRARAPPPSPCAAPLPSPTFSHRATVPWCACVRRPATPCVPVDAASALPHETIEPPSLDPSPSVLIFVVHATRVVPRCQTRPSRLSRSIWSWGRWSWSWSWSRHLRRHSRYQGSVCACAPHDHLR
jgi:hypothetical protein